MSLEKGVTEVSVGAQKSAFLRMFEVPIDLRVWWLKSTISLKKWCPGPDLNWHVSVTQLRILSPDRYSVYLFEITKHVKFLVQEKASFRRQLASIYALSCARVRVCSG